MHDALDRKMQLLLEQEAEKINLAIQKSYEKNQSRIITCEQFVQDKTELCK